MKINVKDLLTIVPLTLAAVSWEIISYVIVNEFIDWIGKFPWVIFPILILAMPFYFLKWILEKYASEEAKISTQTSKYLGIWFCSYYAIANRKIYSIIMIRKKEFEIIDYELRGQEFVEIPSGHNISHSKWIPKKNGSYTICCDENVHTRECVHIDINIISNGKRQFNIARLFNLGESTDIAEGYIHRYSDFGDNQKDILDGQIFLISPDEVKQALGDSKQYGNRVYSTEDCHKLVCAHYIKGRQQTVVNEGVKDKGIGQKDNRQSTKKAEVHKKSKGQQKSQKNDSSSKVYEQKESKTVL